MSKTEIEIPISIPKRDIISEDKLREMKEKWKKEFRHKSLNKTWEGFIKHEQGRS